MGSTLVGPQKHDIRFFLEDLDARYYCSQGEQRALILSLKIAQIMYYKRVRGYYPILLLDDVLSELDREKRFHLIQFLRNINSQIFLTSTELEFAHFFEDQKIEVYNVCSGKLDPVQGEQGL